MYPSVSLYVDNSVFLSCLRCDRAFKSHQLPVSSLSRPPWLRLAIPGRIVGPAAMRPTTPEPCRTTSRPRRGSRGRMKLGYVRFTISLKFYHTLHTRTHTHITSHCTDKKRFTSKVRAPRRAPRPHRPDHQGPHPLVGRRLAVPHGAGPERHREHGQGRHALCVALVRRLRADAQV
jgi:hypothetical protein